MKYTFTEESNKTDGKGQESVAGVFVNPFNIHTAATDVKCNTQVTRQEATAKVFVIKIFVLLGAPKALLCFPPQPPPPAH